VNRSVIFRNLVDPKRGIVLSHETRIGVTPPAHLDHLSWRGLADISLRPIHRLHAWTRSVTAMAGNASKPFRRMNIVFELLDGLGQPIDAYRQMAGRTTIGLLLSDDDCRQK
jgi:hypothetical protein